MNEVRQTQCMIESAKLLAEVGLVVTVYCKSEQSAMQLRKEGVNVVVVSSPGVANE
jgi:hypothetical protein